MGATGMDIGELQQKISDAEKELSTVRAQLEKTKQQAKTAELQSQESGRTNRKLLTEIQTLTDMSNRKDRQAENAKATAFFFESQLKKYMEEIDHARAGMSHLKEMEDEMDTAKRQAFQAQKKVDEEYKSMRAKINSLQKKYQEDVVALKDAIHLAHEQLVLETENAVSLHEEAERRLNDLISERKAIDVEQMQVNFQMQHSKLFVDVEKEVESLKVQLNESMQSSESSERVMSSIKGEMDIIMRRLRALQDVDKY
jgi:chromosome segregation ATPase